MDAFEHFKLDRPPFDPGPDVDFFFDAPGHAEVLATLQYAVAAGKGCCVVVGESGYGKTLLARMVASAVTETAPVLWVHGGGQLRNGTSVSLYPSRRAAGKRELAVPQKTTLAAETHGAEFRSEPPVLIVDCADELPAEGWVDVIAWFSNELRYPRPATVLLFGLPRLSDALTSPELVRLRGRMFRTCWLEPLTVELSKEYVRARIKAAGGEADDIFDDEVLEQIARLGKGNPALINQLCDNALLEAFSEEHNQIAPGDVGRAVYAMSVEKLKMRAALPMPVQQVRPALPPACEPISWDAHGPGCEASPVPDWVDSAPVFDEVEDLLSLRLKKYEDRISQVLSAIRPVEGSRPREACPLEGSDLPTIMAPCTAV